MGIFGVKSFSKNGTILTISNLIASPLQGKLIKFDISKVINPFDIRPATIKIKTMTNDNFLRD